ncbi:hypothetical protein GGS26DRAFT_550782 [Hypomontagnella submonticulosa]|nr:hypothetical protein GGS26DRAFT_550782 [Hypomontagnella submonticulosa]
MVITNYSTVATMPYTYHLDTQRHTFKADDLAIRPVPLPDATTNPPPASTPVLYASVHQSRLTLRRQQLIGVDIASAKFPTKSAKMEIKVAGNRTELTHSFVQVDADGRSTENAKPARSRWRKRILDASRGCYVGVLPDGTVLRWEAAGPKEDPDVAKKYKTRAEKMQPKLRCMLVDGRGASVELLGEMMKSNDVVRLMRGGELQGDSGMLGVYVLLGFLSLYERARTRNKRRAETEWEVSISSLRLTWIVGKRLSTGTENFIANSEKG